MNKSAALPVQYANRVERRGLLLGFISVAISSQILPFTCMAVTKLDAAFVALARTVLASVLALVLLTVAGTFSTGRRPRGHQQWQLAVTTMGVVIGFPLSSPLAMRDVPATHGAIITGPLPLTIAILAAWLGYERPSPGF